MESLKIPVTTGQSLSDSCFVEVFPEEIADTPSSQLVDVLTNELAPLDLWADAALLFMQNKQKVRDAANILQIACDKHGGSKNDRARLLASAGIAHLALAQQATSSSSSIDAAANATTDNEQQNELRGMADNDFTRASKVDQLFPMTWMGRGMLNLSIGRYDQARFFFQTTLEQRGQVLPALLGKGAVMYAEDDYKGAQDAYAQAISMYPVKSGAATRVGFGLACYRLGQVDRAKAAFARALDIDPENVEAMVGSAVLDMASLDETSKEFNSQMEKAIKMMSMANLLDQTNAMVQNHLANHYFWKWTPVPGTATIEEGSTLVKSSQPVPLEPGESIRIGTSFETQVADDASPDEEEDATTFRIRSIWKSPTIKGIKVWKKDYDRVVALAKGAYSSTSVQAIQAESLFFLARVYHVREDYENAHKFYDRACQLSQSLSPARFGLAQTLITQEKYKQAAAHLQIILGTSNTATDALAAVGLLEVKSVDKYSEGLSYLRKAVDLDPMDPNLVLLEALALQQQESNYAKSLESYKKAIQLMERQKKPINAEIFTNVGVICHETKKYDESLVMYKRALESLDEDKKLRVAKMENAGIDGGKIVHPDNSMFFAYLDTGLELEKTSKKDVAGDNDTNDGKNANGKSDDSMTEFVVKDTQSKEASSLPVSVSDHIQIESLSFQSVIVAIKSTETGLALVFQDGMPTGGQDNKENQEDTHENIDKPLKLQVKRENSLLSEPKALTIAFNIARLHEIVGKTIAAVELHKAIVRRNPAYVNSYLRLACIAIDCGALKECAGWLKLAAETAPGNPEVLTLIGNLHLSLCDWAPAQQVFDGLLAKKVPNVEAYAMLSLGNIYFANLKVSPKRYAKHLQYAADYYKRILNKDHSNAYAANGIGTVLAEKGELFKAKEAFNRVRQVSDDSIADAHLNLGHVYLAQKRHPEALQMYQSYMKRTEDGSAPISSKSRVDDLVDVLMYIAFAYFDWARQTELFNNPKAAPADGRYRKAMEFLQLALSKNTSRRIVLTYNLCMTKLQAADCILRKLSRNIRRTAKEVREALDWLKESLEIVEGILRDKQEQRAKVPIATSMLNDFIQNCRSNIDSANSHLEDEIKRETEANEVRQLKLQLAENDRKAKELEEEVRRSELQKQEEERDRRARAAMRKVEDLRVGWEQERAAEALAASNKKTKKGGVGQNSAPDEADDLFPEDNPGNEPPISSANLFEDSSDDDDDDDDGMGAGGASSTQLNGENGKLNGNMNGERDGVKTDGAGSSMFQDGSDDDGNDNPPGGTSQKDLFGDSDSDESDEELVPSSQKRSADDSNGDDNGSSAKKPRVVEDGD